ncbi:MAG: ribonuclease Y [Planctomycetota bacterium]|nr:ribonuclease Y [Planctomycetota bacterium]
MELWAVFLLGAGGFVLGGVIGGVISYVLMNRAQMRAKVSAKQLIEDAKKEAEELKRSIEVAAKEEALKVREDARREAERLTGEFKERERRLQKREDALEQKISVLSRKEQGLERAEHDLRRRQSEFEAKRRELESLIDKEKAALEKVSGMSREEAQKVLLERVSKEMERECEAIVARYLEKAQETAEAKAKEIIVTAMQRVAVEQAQELSVSTVDLPNEEMKGRIIGREGRNIKAFEKATGVDLIVDDTPGVVVVSSFDGLRREVAKRSMERLISDGRIHPARIEEVVEATKKQLNEQIQKEGMDACNELGIQGVHPRLVSLIGRLRFRTSYGQNMLAHSVEVAHICGVIAAELGLDVKTARRCGLLHDIGKAVDQEVEGSHQSIGADLARRYKEENPVVNAIASHHGDEPPASIYAVIVAVADAVSAARPGARRETLEKYIKRLEKLEEIAKSFEGVQSAYAIQAGREVRIIVEPEKISDERASVLARDIAAKIASELTFAGEIKVTVVRETRVVEFVR